MKNDTNNILGIELENPVCRINNIIQDSGKIYIEVYICNKGKTYSRAFEYNQTELPTEEVAKSHIMSLEQFKNLTTWE